MALICEKEMELVVEVVSKELIKPSSPTPDHLRHYQLSFFDQVSPSMYNSLVFFYPAGDHGGDHTEINILKISKQLQKSLSEVLVHFYPLAGHVKDNLYVNCNDEGVYFLQARVNSNLSKFLENPVPDEIKKFIPLQDHDQELLAGIQFNVFECGGIGIGVSVSHKIGDASSFFTFVKALAATTRGDGDKVRTEFVAARLFPPNKNLAGFDTSDAVISKENIVAKRFTFTATSIQALVKKYSESTNLKNQRPPSRIEVLTAFIWNRVMATTKIESGAVLIHPVNLRTRMDPPLPEYSFGNLFWNAATIPSVTSREQSLSLVNKIRESTNKIDSEFVKNVLQDTDKLLAFIKERTKNVNQGDIILFSFASACGFPICEADFGWGKPIWTGSPTRPLADHVGFIDTASGQGIEALVHLKEEDMAKFLEDEELLQFVTPKNMLNKLCCRM